MTMTRPLTEAQAHEPAKEEPAKITADLGVFETLESEVRGYVRSWPTVFTRSRGAHMWDEADRDYIDFFAGAGSLNYGHNEPELKAALIDYLAGDGVVHSLDMATVAKRRFLERFNEVILEPRGLDYKIQFPGPTGTNAVEAALKLARKVTERQLVVGFTNAFHGMTLGSLAVTGNEMKRSGAGVPLSYGVSMPYDDFIEDGDAVEYLRSYLSGGGSGMDAPAAIIVETVQGEGGMHTASTEFLRGLRELADEFECLLIVDDIQMGCGRTGPYFSFEHAGIEPDIVTLSKSISGFGLPMSLTLFRRELDLWGPGEHNGTFRGNNPAFVTATAALERYWTNDDLQRQTEHKASIMEQGLRGIAARRLEACGSWRGRGMAQGLHLEMDGLASEVAREAFTRGLLVETSGYDDSVVKLLPPLTIEENDLRRGIEIIDESLAVALAKRGANAGNGNAGKDTR
jgi:diaminobutyrate-2-oxoglutarate transaminase